MSANGTGSNGLKQPLGIRNNNPGNVRYSTNVDWVGQLGRGEGGFILFDTMEHGVRCAAKILLTYQRRHGLSTVREIISRWAPPNENDTEAYIGTVCAQTHYLPDQLIADDAPTLTVLLKAIFRVELGGHFVTEQDLESGVELALGG